ncbi:hypothetical protein OU789_08375 [Halocynthiibacter sp. C4]|uniref:hypothetical protein n=1 Tax=Halocynthiibacter sp. C4 TaxID=2992758 RepID=UPI00237BB7D7|nr:hypothetical protein [Halocynthiibacter sp. C4]MDE0589936.1 hypothetical protein [Halocynthiibacter sp. C4]
MSDTDSFINEVNEEVQKDQFYAFVRKYWWVAAALVVLLVGGTALNEARKAGIARDAQVFGDSLDQALLLESSDARLAALNEIPAKEGDAGAMLDLLKAAEMGASGDTAGEQSLLQAIVADDDVSDVYKQLAKFKYALSLDATASDDERKAAFSELTAPGAPFRLLAEEQIALIDAGAGDLDAATARLQSIADDSLATPALRQRIGQWLVVLGAPEAAQ